LVIPLYNTDGQIRSIQTIDPEGNKRLAKDAEKAGNFFVVGGSLKDNHPIVLAEGYATAASCAMALRHPVVMTVDSGNLVKVAENLHARYPGSPMLFLGDDDLPKPGRPGNPGKEAAEKAARLTRGTAFVPQFTREEREQGLTDFNDLHQARGLAALTEQLTPVWQQVLARCPAKENIVKETPDNQATPVATNAADMPEM
ncbi:toprim domain-containing protein, partial [Escherichia coli]